MVAYGDGYLMVASDVPILRPVWGSQAGRSRRSWRPVQDVVHPSFQDGEIERLDDEVVHLQLKALEFHVPFCGAGDDLPRGADCGPHRRRAVIPDRSATARRSIVCAGPGRPRAGNLSGDTAEPGTVGRHDYGLRRYHLVMAGSARLVSEQEFIALLEAAPRATPDDVSKTFDGRRLDSKEAVLAWWAEVEPLIEADRAEDHLPTVEELRGQ